MLHGVRILSLLGCMLLAAGCNRRADVLPAAAADQQGVASWYGHPFDGRLTASGQVYDMEKLTAAHRTFPFGTKLRVERIDNHKTVEITVNDRGPFVEGRIIDLSHGAAGAIAMQGISPVNLYVVFRPRTRDLETYAVQVGSYSGRAEAERVSRQFRQQFGPVSIVPREADGTWRVLVGAESSIESATALAARLPKQEAPDFVVLVDPN